MNNYCGGPTWLQWVKQVLDKINEVVERINNLTADVKNVRQLPSGGSHGQVATPNEDGSGYEWVDQSGGGGTGDVTSKGDNTFTGKNTFTQPVTVGEGTSPNHAARVHQVTELGDKVNAIASASVTKDNDQTITGVKTFAVSPKVPNPTNVGDATPKSYVDNEVDTASSETLNEAKTYADGLETKIKDAAVADIKAADNVFTGNNTFANPVSVGTPTAAGEAATKKYVDDADSTINTNINRLTQNQTALQEEVQQIQNGALGRMNAATVADKDKVWTSTEANPSGEFVTPTGGGSSLPNVPAYANRYLRTKDSNGNLEWGKISFDWHERIINNAPYFSVYLSQPEGKSATIGYVKGIAVQQYLQSTYYATSVRLFMPSTNQISGAFTPDTDISEIIMQFRGHSTSYFISHIGDTPTLYVNDSECSPINYDGDSFIYIGSGNNKVTTYFKYSVNMKSGTTYKIRFAMKPKTLFIYLT